MRNKLYTIMLLGFLFSFAIVSHSQENEEIEKIEPSMSLSYFKKADGVKSIKAKVKTRINRKWTPISDLDITFYMMGAEDEKMLGTVKSNDEGIAELQISAEYPIYFNEDLAFLFLVRTADTDKYEMTEDEIELYDIELKIEAAIIDEEKTVSVSAQKLNSDGEYEIVSDEDVNFYVPRMFTDLRFGEGYLEEGVANAIFPDNITGDSIGKVLVIARIEEHDMYGNVEISQTIDWAIPTHSHLQALEARTLWTPIAPLWMIITMIIMLLGVWGHYGYTVIQIIKIRNEGKRLEA